MGIFTEYLNTLRLQNESYHNLTLFEVLSPDRMKRPFDAANWNKVVNSSNFDKVTFKSAYDKNLEIMSQLQKVAEIEKDQEGKTFPRFELPITHAKIQQITDIFRQISSPIIDDIADGMIYELRQNLEQNPELAMEMEREIEKRSIEFARSYIFNLLPNAHLFTSTEGNQPTVIALNDLVIICDAKNPIEEFYMLHEKKLQNSMAYEPNKPQLTPPSDVKLGKLLLVMGVDRFTDAVHELFPALAREANVKPETLILNEIKITSHKDKPAMIAVKILQDTFKRYIKSAKQSAKEIEKQVAKQQLHLEKESVPKMEKKSEKSIAPKNPFAASIKHFFEKKITTTQDRSFESKKMELSKAQLKQEDLFSKEESQLKSQMPKSQEWKERHKGMVIKRDETTTKPTAKPSHLNSPWVSAKPSKQTVNEDKEEANREEEETTFKH